MLLKKLLSAFFILLSSNPLVANPMIHQDGSIIVDGQGKPIKLRGVLIEGWLMWNGPMWGAGVLSSETHIVNKLTELVGTDEMEKFRRDIYQHFIDDN